MAVRWKGVRWSSTHLAGIFADHATATYVGKVRVVRFPTSDVGVLHAVVGMVPRGQTELKPDVNAIQTMVAVKASEKWLITLFQNTPAAFHGRPDLSQQLTGRVARGNARVAGRLRPDGRSR
jgi:uncharacterized protein (TIGR02246 family)